MAENGSTDDPRLRRAISRAEAVLSQAEAQLADLSGVALWRRSLARFWRAVSHAPLETRGDLEAELKNQLDEMERSLVLEQQAAEQWEHRARLAREEDREDLAQQSIDRAQEHRVAVAALQHERAQWEAVLDRLRQAAPTPPI